MLDGLILNYLLELIGGVEYFAHVQRYVGSP